MIHTCPRPIYSAQVLGINSVTVISKVLRKRDVRNADVGVNEVNQLLYLIDGALGALTPPVGTAREFTDRQRQVCEFGLNLAKFALKSLDSLRISHNGNGSVMPNTN